MEGDVSQPEIALEQIRLRCNAPEGTLTPQLRQELRDRKAELVAYLLEAQNPSSLSAECKVLSASLSAECKVLSAEWEESAKFQVPSSEKYSSKSVFPLLLPNPQLLTPNSLLPPNP
uniref:Uncharacterized protein n=1 Tax=Desertifilum tharense IPPAS B-1220 TaxID=1781255 RepID=A0ACD5H1E9_9CYAN